MRIGWPGTRSLMIRSTSARTGSAWMHASRSWFIRELPEDRRTRPRALQSIERRQRGSRAGVEGRRCMRGLDCSHGHSCSLDTPPQLKGECARVVLAAQFTGVLQLVDSQVGPQCGRFTGVLLRAALRRSKGRKCSGDFRRQPARCFDVHCLLHLGWRWRNNKAMPKLRQVKSKASPYFDGRRAKKPALGGPR